MMKKKVLYSVLIVLLVSFVLAAYNAFNGNPVSKKLSQTALEHYLTDRYPEKTCGSTTDSIISSSPNMYLKSLIPTIKSAKIPICFL
ncbi:hypothetical protein QKW34_04115 [Bacillus licheniformis]|nr:hypothetical protein QKW34_04115 [Bacillus licheniformis]